MWDFEGEKNTKEKIINQKVIAKCKLLVKFTGGKSSVGQLNFWPAMT